MGILQNDLTGKTFGRLKVLKRSGTGSHKAVLYKCLCSCGKITIKRYGNLINGYSKSCGCLHIEIFKKITTKHGLSGSGYYYRTWVHIKQRCYNPKDNGYKNYGKRGITLYEKWFCSFEKFYNYIIKNLGERPSKKHSLDRIDNNKGYYPSNIRWAVHAIQKYNKRKRLKTKNKYRGVCKNEYGKFRAIIRKNKKTYNIGNFSTELEAVRAYNKKAIELYGFIPKYK